MEKMLFETEIQPASSTWRQPLQMRARHEVIPGVDWDSINCGFNVDCASFHNVSFLSSPPFFSLPSSC